jgi:hypothetical protein
MTMSSKLRFGSTDSHAALPKLELRSQVRSQAGAWERGLAELLNNLFEAPQKISNGGGAVLSN